MTVLLIAVIYLAFISLGLPDALLGAAWPVMAPELGAGLSWAGIVSTIISCGTIVSSLLSDRVTRRLGTGVVTAVSVGLTALALLGFSIAHSFWLLCLIAVPYGLGAGAVDAALNNYVAVHYDSKYMNWLHCFWGVGAAIGPYIMGACLGTAHGWRGGYGGTGLIQILMTAILLAALPLWKKTEKPEGVETTRGTRSVWKLPGVMQILVAFFAYCALESTAGLWASSYLVGYRGVDAVTASRFAGLFYVGMTVGRFGCGFISDCLGDKAMIRGGTAVMVAGVLLILQPLRSSFFPLLGLVVLGLGAAPVYPAIIHSTPARVGKENSQAVVGVQMAAAYTGSTMMPPLFGLLAQNVSLALYPWFLGVFLFVTIAITGKVKQFSASDS